jgi:hypothetical protein
MRKRYVYRNGKLVEDVKVQRRNFHNIQPDIKPYFSVASNRMIGSRSTRREDLKITGCREVDPSEKEDFLKPREHEDFKFSPEELHQIDKIYRGERID